MRLADGELCAAIVCSDCGAPMRRQGHHAVCSSDPAEHDHLIGAFTPPAPLTGVVHINTGNLRTHRWLDLGELSGAGTPRGDGMVPYDA